MKDLVKYDISSQEKVCIYFYFLLTLDPPKKIVNVLQFMTNFLLMFNDKRKLSIIPD